MEVISWSSSSFLRHGKYLILNNLFQLYELLALSVDYPSFCHYNKTNVKIG